MSTLSYELALIVTALVILIYVLLSGFRAVILTDVIQSGIMLALLSLVAWGAYTQTDLSALHALEANLPLGEVVGFVLFGILSIFAASDRYQLVFASKDVRAAKQGMLFSVIPVAITFVLLLIIGLTVALAAPGLDPDLVFLHFIETMLSPELLPFVLVLLFAGLMSTADTNVYLIGLYAARLHSRWRDVRHTRIAMIAVVVLSTTAALVARDIVDTAILSGACMLSIAIGMIYIIAGGTQAHKFIASVVGGVIGVVLGISLLGLSPAAAPFPIIGALMGLLWPARWTNAPKNTVA